MKKQTIAPVDWRLFEWERGDWYNPASPLHTGKYQDYSALIVHANNTEYTWEISWPSLAHGINHMETGDNFRNETGAMLSADVWLYKRLNPTEAK